MPKRQKASGGGRGGLHSADGASLAAGLVAASGAATVQANVQSGGLTEQQHFRAAAELRAAHLTMQASIAPLVTALFFKCFSVGPIQLEIARSG